jgi:hypothetical protein
MKPYIVLLAAVSFTTPLSYAGVGAMRHSAKNLDINLDIGNNEDPAEFAEDLRAMGIDDQASGFAPGESSSRLSVLIDKPTQTITVFLDDRVVLHDKVSTGGTLKSPNNPRNPKSPRCANTPEYKMYIPANNQTMFPVWKSNTYVSSKTLEPVPMPYAIHIQGGFFLHEVPPSAVGYLGYAVSGGCIRLPSKTARTLYAMMKQYGGIKLEIRGPNPSPVNNPPPYNHYCKKDANGIARKIAVKGGRAVVSADSRAAQPLNIAPQREGSLAEQLDVFKLFH